MKFAAKLWMFAFMVGCHPAQVPPPAAAHAEVEAPLPKPPPVHAEASAAPATCELGDRAHQFLMHTEEGAIIIKSSTSSCVRVLVQEAGRELYDPALELLWYGEGDGLKVLDLRDLAAPPVLIASGVPEEIDQYSIHRGSDSAHSESGCGTDDIELTWAEKPKIIANAPESDASNLKLVNTDWLRAQLKRPARKAGGRDSFGEPRVRLPKQLRHCDIEEACGNKVDFGATGLQLVQTLINTDGDCAELGCLLYDPQSKTFESPLGQKTWDRKGPAPIGACGLYFFDREQSSYLIRGRLCTATRECRDIGGYAVGWLEPGNVVGEPGGSDFE